MALQWAPFQLGSARSRSKTAFRTCRVAGETPPGSGDHLDQPDILPPEGNVEPGRSAAFPTDGRPLIRQVHTPSSEKYGSSGSRAPRAGGQDVQLTGGGHVLPESTIEPRPRTPKSRHASPRPQVVLRCDCESRSRFSGPPIV
jgi:hypothetical protein